MKTNNLFRIVLFFFLFMSVSHSLFANNISVTNFSFTGQNTTNHYIMVKFDISWENSWRTSSALNNWDAAWVFVKYRVGTGTWQHAWLNNTGHINPTGSTISTGLLKPDSAFNATNNPGLGAFIYRDANTFSKAGVQLRWNYGANGLNDNAVIDIRVYAIEQVYVPQGNFSIGSGGAESNHFYRSVYPDTAITNTYPITGEGQITVGTAVNNLYMSGAGLGGDRLGPIPAAFPKGYYAFYCMKYELSQQEYVDFLNSLTANQASNRYSTASTGYRYGISESGGIYSTTTPYLACNFIS
ncbi:MAG: hypothetical protein NTV87_11920, partial [Ignavibacteriae bacterium]|nr:hypothetical protein [Ignavibacteriota bacterium]